MLLDIEGPGSWGDAPMRRLVRSTVAAFSHTWGIKDQSSRPFCRILPVSGGWHAVCKTPERPLTDRGP
jgi:hypothetical protein